MVAEVCAWGTDSAPAPHQMAWRRATGTLPEWRGVRATVNVLCENCPRWKLGPGGLYLEMVAYWNEATYRAWPYDSNYPRNAGLCGRVPTGGPSHSVCHLPYNDLGDSQRPLTDAVSNVCPAGGWRRWWQCGRRATPTAAKAMRRLFEGLPATANLRAPD